MAPGLGCFLGHVNVTPRQTIGTRYVMIADLARLNRTAEELFDRVADRQRVMVLTSQGLEDWDVLDLKKRLGGR